MCWSATADLTAGTVITAVGIACLARTRHARDLPVAALPLILGTHQLIEAAVWRSADGSGSGCGPATTAWAVIALPLLPVWVPLAVLLAAAPEVRPRLLRPATVGLATGAYLAYCLATRPVSAEVRGHTLGYGVNVPWMPLALAGYLYATLGALLLAGDRRLRLLGLLMAVGALVSAALWRLEFASTWCAFAAAASTLILVWTGDRARSPSVREGAGRGAPDL
ncbi:DUF6629 family protein [Streptomyces sp. NPDC002886]|uniref:DUF6629 family protein n=1 Tax=Streptomyces sp. NPDC002886 TaxID=3364667 RepID=UPI00367586AD